MSEDVYYDGGLTEHTGHLVTPFDADFESLVKTEPEYVCPFCMTILEPDRDGQARCGVCKELVAPALEVAH